MRGRNAAGLESHRLIGPTRVSRRRPVWWAALALVAGVLPIATSARPPGAAAAPIVPIAVTITSITQPDDSIDPGVFQGPWGDFYAGVTITGTKLDNFANHLTNGFELGVGYLFPATFNVKASEWTLSKNVDAASGPVPVSIEIWDNDDCDDPFCTDTGILGNNDDQADVKPAAGRALDIVVDPTTGRWTGDVNWPTRCATGAESDWVTVCFEVSIDSATGDADSDGLLDSWERNGYDADGNGTVDVPLPGANPQRKDLYLEIDCVVDDRNGNGSLGDLVDHSHCPTQNAVSDVVTGFARAPVPNPDGTTGVQLHVDTGLLYGGGITNVAGPGGVTATFGNLGGGGSQIPEAGNTVIDFDGAAGNPGTNYFTLKQANFNQSRARIYRYGIFGHQTNSRQATNDCTSGKADGLPGNDFYVTLGGGRDRDANGVADTTCWGSSAANGRDDDGDGRVDEDAADGVDNDADCVPGTDTNSDMTNCGPGDIGVDEDGGESVGNRTQQAGTLMHEFGHTLGLQHGGNDEINNKPNYLSVMNYTFQSCSVPVSPTPVVVPGGCDFSRNVVDLSEGSLDECVGVGQGFGANDWNMGGGVQGVTNCQPPRNSNIAFDISGDGSNTNLPGFDDWGAVEYNFEGTGVFADGATSSPPLEADPAAIEAAVARLSALTRPVLTVSVTGPATAVPGDTLTFQTNVLNGAGGASLQTSLVVTPPYVGSTTFPIGALVVGTSTSKTVSTPVPSDACPTTLITTAVASFVDLASVPGSASGQASTTVLDVTPPKITIILSPSSLWPPNHQMVPITATIVATDECDPNPLVRLVSVVSSEPDNGLGDGDLAADIADATPGTDDRSISVRSERAGGGIGRTYTVRYRATDASGNNAEATATVIVPKSKK